MSLPTIEQFDKEMSDRADVLIKDSVKIAKEWEQFITDIIERHKHLPDHLVQASTLQHLRRIEAVQANMEKGIYPDIDTTDVADDFDSVWERLADRGSCDALGGAEYERVKSEYKLDIEQFIISKANEGPE